VGTLNGQLVGYASICIGILLPVGAFFARSISMRERRWVKVVGKITSTEVEYDGELYRPRVRYLYRYNDIEYSGKTIRSHGLLYNFKQPAERLCARYLTGANVGVFLDPDEPSRSVLEPGGDPKLLPVAVIASLFLIMVGVLLVNNHA
jgi:Protein of unknown function (DUF3592)